MDLLQMDTMTNTQIIICWFMFRQICGSAREIFQKHHKMNISGFYICCIDVFWLTDFIVDQLVVMFYVSCKQET